MSRGRWPFAEKDADARQASEPAPSMLAPGMPRRTPGMVRVKDTKLRPFKGRVLICDSSMVAASSEEEVCRSGVSAWIEIDSVTAPISSFRSMRTFASTPSWTLDMAIVLNPASSAATL